MDKKLKHSGRQRGEPGSYWWLNPGSHARGQPEDDAALRKHPARASVRRHLELRAVINHGLSYTAAWPIRDLSMTGAFVEMSAADVREGALVEFVLQARYQDRELEHRFPAKILRVTPDGVAVEFGKYDDAAYTDLTNLLYAM
jgi:hypothetical protein